MSRDNDHQLTDLVNGLTQQLQPQRTGSACSNTASNTFVDGRSVPRAGFKQRLQQRSFGEDNGPRPWGPVDHTTNYTTTTPAHECRAINAVSFGVRRRFGGSERRN